MMTFNKQEQSTTRHKWLQLLALMIAGEAIFFLPFVLARVFRPTLLAVLELSNFALGIAFSYYGMVAMMAYFFGGPIADAFKPRKLIATALITTAIGGFIFANIPNLTTLKWLYAYWGLTTIALFWAALMRATREWGGQLNQGKAFGLLDGGRGIIAAMVGTILVVIFGALMPEQVASTTTQARNTAFSQIIFITSMMTLAAAALIWFTLPKQATQTDKPPRINFAGMRHAAILPTVWLQALIILCAYVGYKGIDDFSLYAKEVLQLNEVEAAKVSVIAFWIRPIAAISAGYLADKLSNSLMTIISFALMAIGSLILASNMIQTGMLGMFLITIMASSLGVFALRGLYFAIMQEGKVPLAYTGSAVGLVSVIGYTPDIFMGPLMGYLLDHSPGATGHQHVFLVIFCFAMIGLLASLLFRHMTSRQPTH